MTKFQATADHFAKTAKAYAAAIGSMLTGLIASGVVLPAPYDRYLAAAAAVTTAVSVFKVPNRREVLDADVEAAREAFDAIKAAGAPAADAPHPPVEASPAPSPVAAEPQVTPPAPPAPATPDDTPPSAA